MAEESMIQQQGSAQGQALGNTQAFPHDPSQMPTPEEVQGYLQDDAVAPGSTQEFLYDPSLAPAPEEVQEQLNDLTPPAGEQDFVQETTSNIDQVTAPDPVQVRAIVVRTGRLMCDVQIPDVRFRYTTPRLSAFANGQYPDLPHHACVNGVGDTFGYVMEKTSVAHLLEHLTISEQVRSQSAGAATFVGTTEWLDEPTGLARIEVGFKDDLVALRAFNEATRFLNIAVLTCLA